MAGAWWAPGAPALVSEAAAAAAAAASSACTAAAGAWRLDCYYN